MKSPVYTFAFWLVVAVYLLFVEFYVRLSPAHQGSVAVLRAWLGQGNARILLTVIWLTTTLSFAALAADHVRNIYISLSSTPQTYIFLGDKLREGMYVAKESDALRRPMFVESFISKNQYPSATFRQVYELKVLWQDREGNLTPAEMFNTGRLLLFSVIQLVLLLFSVLCVIAVVDQYLAGFPGVNRIHDLSRAISLPQNFKIILLSVLVLMYVAGVALMKFNLRSVTQTTSKIPSLPANIAAGTLLSGKVVAAENFEINNAGRSTDDARFYRRYAVSFEEDGLPLPVYLNWWHERLHEGNINEAVGQLKKDRQADREYYDRLFSHLDQAMTAGGRVEFRVGEDLDITPLFE